MRNVWIPLSEVFTIIYQMKSYCTDSSSIYDILATFSGRVREEEIERYASWFISEEGMELGYTKEDYVRVKEVLTEWKKYYIDHRFK